MSTRKPAPKSLALQAVSRAQEESSADGVDAEDAVKALELALHAAGVTMPDLGPDGCVCGWDTSPIRFVLLGRVKPEEALKLAELIAKGATA